MTDYFYLSIREIVFARKIGYIRAIKYMLNHELSIEPKKFGTNKTLKMAKELQEIHQNLKSMKLPKNRKRNEEIATQAYFEIRDKYISPLKNENRGTLGDTLDD